MSMTLEKLSEDFAEAVESASSSVIRVEGRSRLAASGILWKEPGVIITAHHVLQRDEKLSVGLPSGEKLKAELVGRDASVDLAVVRVESDLSSAVWKATDRLRVGHLVLALGRPGKNVMATHGIISSLLGELRIPFGSKEERLIQTDVVMYPGFSGGPLVDTNGVIIGMNTSGLQRGISVSLPLQAIEGRVTALLAHGYIRRGYLGISLQPVRLPTSLRRQVKQETGLLISGIEEDSPAEKANLFQGDVLLSVNNDPLRFPDDLLHHLGKDQIGDEITLSLIRGGALTEIKVVVGERSST